jgi:hypothetical protein
VKYASFALEVPGMEYLVPWRMKYRVAHVNSARENLSRYN